MIDLSLSDNWFLHAKEIEKVIHFISIVKGIPEEKIIEMTVEEVEKILDEITSDDITLKKAYLFALFTKPKKRGLIKRLIKWFRR